MILIKVSTSSVSFKASLISYLALIERELALLLSIIDFMMQDAFILQLFSIAKAARESRIYSCRMKLFLNK